MKIIIANLKTLVDMNTRILREVYINYIKNVNYITKIVKRKKLTLLKTYIKNVKTTCSNLFNNCTYFKLLLRFLNNFQK